MKYRVKQVGYKFYPQSKKRFSWHYYNGRPYMGYGTMSFISGQKDYVFYEDLYFNSLEEANEFLIKQKQLDTVKYHEIKN